MVKKILCFLSVILITIFALEPLHAQTKTQNQTQTHTKGEKVGEKVEMIVQQKWYCENKGDWGSFWWKVERSVKTNSDGWYTYKVYLYSNSFFNTDNNADGSYDKAISYVTDLNVTMYEYQYNAKTGTNDIYSTLNVPLAYVLCDWSDFEVAIFTSKSKINTVNINYSGVSPYNYSKK